MSWLRSTTSANKIHKFNRCHICPMILILFEHPDLLPFLEKLKEQKVIANITVHQVHFMQNLELIRKLKKENLIYGIGVSVSTPTEELIKALKSVPDTVCHVINGI